MNFVCSDSEPTFDIIIRCRGVQSACRIPSTRLREVPDNFKWHCKKVFQPASPPARQPARPAIEPALSFKMQMEASRTEAIRGSFPRPLAAKLVGRLREGEKHKQNTANISPIWTINYPGYRSTAPPFHRPGCHAGESYSGFIWAQHRSCLPIIRPELWPLTAAEWMFAGDREWDIANFLSAAQLFDTWNWVLRCNCILFRQLQPQPREPKQKSQSNPIPIPILIPIPIPHSTFPFPFPIPTAMSL